MAIKAFELELTPEQVEVFANALADIVNVEMSHPAIVAPLAAGLEAGMPFMAYEYIAAESLDVVLRREARPAEALEWIAALAGGVDAAHARGVVHGTLHLRDVLVSPEGICATGFGIASALEHVRLRVPVRRPYTAGEVTAGRRWGPPADRFSLAVLAYELLTGTRPSASGDEAIADLPDLCPDVADPAGLQQAFRNALAVEPAIRSASATAFAQAVARAIGDEEPAGSVSTMALGREPVADDAADRFEETSDPRHRMRLGDAARGDAGLAFEAPESVGPAGREFPGTGRGPELPVQIALPDGDVAPEGPPAGRERSGDEGDGEHDERMPRSPRRPVRRAGAPRRTGPVVAVRDDVHFDPLDDRDALAPTVQQATNEEDVPPPPSPTSMRTVAPVIAAVVVGMVVASLVFRSLWTAGEETSAGAPGPAEAAGTGVEFSEETVAPPPAQGSPSAAESLRLVEEPIVSVGDPPLRGAESLPPTAQEPEPLPAADPPEPLPAADPPEPESRAADAVPLGVSPPSSIADPPAAAETRAASAGPNDPAPGAPPAVSAVGGSLRVESRPPGAAVRVDDVVMGVTPVDITDVPPGARRVRIELPGYRPWITEVDVSGTERIRVGASLQPEDRQ